jgi:hypothetical protein
MALQFIAGRLVARDFPAPRPMPVLSPMYQAAQHAIDVFSASKAQEFGRFSRTACTLGWGRKLEISLRPSFLCGCSTRPFGTHSVLFQKISPLGQVTKIAVFELWLGWPS